jgi:serine/threonine-protein kinase
VTWLSDAAVDRLRAAADWPDLAGMRYDVLEVIGRGGMGSVYLAHDRELDRPVALKVLAAAAAGPAAAARMLKEARIIARLEHPGIVPVHDVGTLPDGRVFYAMKRVEGRRLDQLVAEGRPLAELLPAFERVCESVAFAHAHGVIHRDLKPENVMLGAFGEALVMDWGVAKLAGAGQEPEPLVPSGAPGTAHGTILGTPGYMAPEQARGDVAGTDVRADVYALGAILHFILLGRPPFRGRFGSEVTTRTQSGAEPASAAVESLRAERPDVPRALEAVCLKALALDPARRYASALELAGEVHRFLAEGATAAYREGPLERAGRFVRRHRTPIALVLAYVVMRGLLIVFSGM